MHDREERRDARCNYYRTVNLENQLHASKGKGKGKSSGHSVKAWADMSPSEQWWLRDLWNGRLLNAMKEAEAKCHRVQAPPFKFYIES